MIPTYHTDIGGRAGGRGRCRGRRRCRSQTAHEEGQEEGEGQEGTVPFSFDLLKGVITKKGIPFCFVGRKIVPVLCCAFRPRKGSRRNVFGGKSAGMRPIPFFWREFTHRLSPFASVLVEDCLFLSAVPSVCGQIIYSTLFLLVCGYFLAKRLMDKNRRT